MVFKLDIKAKTTTTTMTLQKELIPVTVIGILARVINKMLAAMHPDDSTAVSSIKLPININKRCNGCYRVLWKKLITLVITIRCRIHILPYNIFPQSTQLTTETKIYFFKFICIRSILNISSISVRVLTVYETLTSVKEFLNRKFLFDLQMMK